MGKHIMIKNVRCSFPQLYKKVEIRKGKEFKPGMTVLLHPEKDAKVIAELKGEIKSVIEGNSELKKKPPKGEKLCLKKPDSESYRDEFPEGHYLLRAGNSELPLVLHKNRERMSEDDNKIYSGCRVNIKVELWGQSNDFGKRVNAKLIAVQFAGDDTPFDSSYVSEETAAEGFGSVEDDGFDEDAKGESDAGTEEEDDVLG